MCRLEIFQNLTIVQYGINVQSETNILINIFFINTLYLYLHIIVLNSVETQNILIALLTLFILNTNQVFKVTMIFLKNISQCQIELL